MTDTQTAFLWLGIYFLGAILFLVLAVVGFVYGIKLLSKKQKSPLQIAIGLALVLLIGIPLLQKLWVLLQFLTQT